MQNRLLSASTIAGDSVMNTLGETLGEIKDLMIDPENGKIEYAVLSFGGFLGMGDKLFAIPYSQLSLDRQKKCLILNVEKDRLKSAPGFDKDNWPDFANENFRQQLSSFYG